MDTLSTLFLHSSRMYSGLSDTIFGDSVEQSQFASTISARRMQMAKAIMGTALDVDIELDDEDMEIITAEDSWQACLALDNLLMRVMADDEQTFLPLLNGVLTAAHRGLAYASRADRPEHKLCLACGAIFEQWECPVCDSARNWLVGVEIPENTEAPEIIVDTTEDISLPNLSFGDFAPELPVQPQKWEVSFDGRKGDIFTATGLARPTLG